MDPGERITGTRDEHYNLVSVLYHALEGAENCDIYAVDAEAAGREEYAAFFREAQSIQVEMAEQAKVLLGIIEVPPEPEIAPDIPPEVPPEVPPEIPTEVPPEDAVAPGTVSGGMPPGPEVPPEGLIEEEPPAADVTSEPQAPRRVEELMTPAVVTVEPEESVADAARRMIEQEKGPLPVIEGDRLVGMVTDRDIVARVVAEGRNPGSTTVQDIATRELVTVSAEQDIDEAIRRMEEHQLDRIMVVEGERLVGIISEADIRLDEGPLF